MQWQQYLPEQKNFIDKYITSQAESKRGSAIKTRLIFYFSFYIKLPDEQSMVIKQLNWAA
jgi:hypothetical protein